MKNPNEYQKKEPIVSVSREKIAEECGPAIRAKICDILYYFRANIEDTTFWSEHTTQQIVGIIRGQK